MRNCVVTIVGQKGSGKTTLAKLLTASAPRSLVLDRMLEYDTGTIIGSYETALGALAAAWRQDFRHILRFTEDWHHREYFNYIVRLASECPDRPISITLEEADHYMGPNRIEAGVAYFYNYGRHYRINVISVARGETDLHRAAINNVDALVVMRTRKFSRSMEQRFSREEIEQIRELESLRPGIAPVKGKHYLTDPDDADPFALWRECQA